jgi:hypothetical protein
MVNLTSELLDSKARHCQLPIVTDVIFGMDTVPMDKPTLPPLVYILSYIEGNI